MPPYHVYFFCRRRSSGASSQITFLFFKSVTQSIMMYCRTVWLSSQCVKLKTKLYNQIQICAKINGQPMAHCLQVTHNKSMFRFAHSISSDFLHVLNWEHKLLPSGRRFRVPQFICNRLKNQDQCSDNWDQNPEDIMWYVWLSRLFDVFCTSMKSVKHVTVSSICV